MLEAIFKHGNSLIWLQHNLLIAAILAKKLCCAVSKEHHNFGKPTCFKSKIVLKSLFATESEYLLKLYMYVCITDRRHSWFTEGKT